MVWAKDYIRAENKLQCRLPGHQYAVFHYKKERAMKASPHLQLVYSNSFGYNLLMVDFGSPASVVYGLNRKSREQIPSLPPPCRCLAEICWSEVMVWRLITLAKLLGECSTIHSPSALFFFSFFFFAVEVRSRTLIPLSVPGSVDSGSVSWDDCGRMFPEKLRVSSFPDRFPHNAWTAA